MRIFSKLLIINLLRGNFKCLTPHIDLLINIKTGDDEEDSRPPGSSCQQPAKPEDDGSLVLLNRNDNYLLIRGFTGWQESNCSDNIELVVSPPFQDRKQMRREKIRESYLDNFHHEHQRERESQHDEEEGDDCEEQSAQAGPLLAAWRGNIVTPST